MFAIAKMMLMFGLNEELEVLKVV